MHILITGSKGQLGRELRELSSKWPQYQFIFTDIDELDITDNKKVEHFFKDNQPYLVINCAAYTAVDKSETDRLTARSVNVLAVKNLALACSKHQAKLIHISTDYVYTGHGPIPYRETDFTNPLTYYGQTKLEGEEMVEEFAADAVIIRTSWLYSQFGHNFVKTILNRAQQGLSLNVVFDQIGSPTYAADLAEVILNSISKMEFMSGVHLFNYSNEGVCSWYDFAKAIIDIKGLNTVELLPVETSAYPLAAPRPAYSVLNKSKIKEELEMEIPYWRDSLVKCLKQL
jgi:dTDP-4-dehydrorhamnose reductase